MLDKKELFLFRPRILDIPRENISLGRNSIIINSNEFFPDELFGANDSNAQIFEFFKEYIFNFDEEEPKKAITLMNWGESGLGKTFQCLEIPNNSK